MVFFFIKTAIVHDNALCVFTTGEILMRLFCLLLSALLAAAAQADEPKKDPYLDKQVSEADIKVLQGRSEPLVQKAVAEIVAAEPAPEPNPVQTGVVALNPVRQDVMTAAFIEAKVPDCLHSEGLKRQPTFFLKGILKLPFVPIAYLRGVCN
jgi:hypothetical protein